MDAGDVLLTRHLTDLFPAGTQPLPWLDENNKRMSAPGSHYYHALDKPAIVNGVREFRAYILGVF